MLESLTLSAPHCSLGDLDSKYRHLLCLCCVGDIKDAGDQMRVTLELDVFAPSRTQFGCLGHILTIPSLSPCHWFGCIDLVSSDGQRVGSVLCNKIVFHSNDTKVQNMKY